MAATSATRIPKDLAAVIRKCWPGGEVEEFDTEESWFHDVKPRIERDLRKIPGASLRWETEEDDRLARWDSDWDDEPPPPGDDFCSYHEYFLSPAGAEFHYEDETESLDEVPPEEVDEEEEPGPKNYSGECWIGCVAAISLVAPLALTRFDTYCRYEDGSSVTPDIEDSCEPGEVAAADSGYRQSLGDAAYRKLEELRERIAAVLGRYGVRMLDNAVLDLPAPGLRASEELFVNRRLRVRDVFFFRGV